MSGSTNPVGDSGRDEKESSNATWLLPLIALIAVPLLVLSAAATWLLFSVVHIRRSVIALALLAYALIASIFIVPIVNLFVSSWVHTMPDIFTQKVPVVGGVLLLVAQQAPLSLPLGVAAGLIYASYRWFNRPVWQTIKFRRTPWELYALRKNTRDIKNDQHGPENGTTLGVTDYGRKIVQTDKEASAHTLVVGASGSGKTTELMSKARDAVRRGHGLIFIDLKGGKDVPEILNLFAKRYDRKFRHWLIQDPTKPYAGPATGPSYYDPIARGDATRRKDLLIAGRSWEGGNAEYFKIQASSYLQMLFNVQIAKPDRTVSTFADVVALLDPKALQTRAIPLGKDPNYQLIVKDIDRLNDAKLSKGMMDAVDGLRSEFTTILHSSAGKWLQMDPAGEHQIDLFRAAHEGEIVVFSLDSSNYQELARLVANLIIQDLKTVTSELREDPVRKPVQIFVDEFSAIGSDNIIGLINKARDANMPVTFSTQALGDLRKVDPTFTDQVLGIINSFIIHRANTEDDAEVYAGLTNKVVRKKFRQAVEHSSNRIGLGRGKGTGAGTVEDVEEYRVLPKEIQDLKMGQNIYITKSPLRLERVNVIPEDDAMTSNFTRTQYAPTTQDIAAGLTATTVSMPILANGMVDEADETAPSMMSLRPLEDDTAFPTIISTEPQQRSSLNLNLNKGFPAQRQEEQRPRAVPAAPPPATTPSVPVRPVAKPHPVAVPNRPVRAVPQPIKPAVPARPPVPLTAKPDVLADKTKSSNPIKPSTPKPPRRKDEFEF